MFYILGKTEYFHSICMRQYLLAEIKLPDVIIILNEGNIYQHIEYKYIIGQDHLFQIPVALLFNIL